jgi:hypothetical protein
MFQKAPRVKGFYCKIRRNLLFIHKSTMNLIVLNKMQQMKKKFALKFINQLVLLHIHFIHYSISIDEKFEKKRIKRTSISTLASK